MTFHTQNRLVMANHTERKQQYLVNSPFKPSNLAINNNNKLIYNLLNFVNVSNGLLGEGNLSDTLIINNTDLDSDRR